MIGPRRSCDYGAFPTGVGLSHDGWHNHRGVDFERAVQRFSRATAVAALCRQKHNSCRRATHTEVVVTTCPPSG